MGKGKFGASSTALQVVQGHDLSGKVAIVTGGNSGIGVETVRALASAGCKVILTSRSAASGQAVASAICKEPLKGSVVVKALDLADLVSIQKFVRDYKASEAGPDLLILNAGVGITPPTQTKDGFELQIGTNHYGHQYLTELLLPGMKKLGRPARVVSVASEAHKFHAFDLTDLHYRRRPYNKWRAYGDSKLANMLFAKELAKRCTGSNILVFSLHPGAILTGLGRHLAAPGGWLDWTLKLAFKPFFKTPAQGAATTVYAAVAEVPCESGSYLVDCKEGKSLPIASDMALAEKLWVQTDQELKDALKARQETIRAEISKAEEDLKVLQASV